MSLQPGQIDPKLREQLRADADHELPLTTPRRQVLGLSVYALVEIALFIAATVALDLLFFDGQRFQDVRPHPFWALVLLVTVQYGSAEGLLAAVSASIALYAGAVPEQEVDQDLYAYLFEIAVRPALWLATAIVLGELRMRERRRVLQLAQRLEETEQRERTLADAYHQLVVTKDSLEARIAGQLKTVFALYKAAKAIERLGPGEVLMGIDDLVNTVLLPRKFSLFLLNSNQLEAVLNEGWESRDRFSRVYDASDPLFEAVVGRRQFLCSVKPDDQRVLSDQGLLAGPLISADTGEIIGMLKIEAIGFLELNLQAIDNFRVLCDWIGTAFAKALKFEEVESGSLYTPEQVLFSSGFLESQTKVIAGVARRVGFDVSLLLIRLEGAPALGETARQDVYRIVADVIHEELRLTDMTFERRRSSWQICVLLPATTPRGAEIALDKLIESLNEAFRERGLAINAEGNVQTLYSPSEERPAVAAEG